MKTHRRQRLEIWFYAGLSGLVGTSIGYFWAAATAAAHVREALK